MSEIAERLEALSPERRLLLQLVIEERRRGVDYLPISPCDDDDERKHLSYGQRRLWFLDQLEPGSPLYNMQAPVLLSGSLNLCALEQALNEIVRRHESLRTCFRSTDGIPSQTCLSTLQLKMPLVDLRGLDPRQRKDCLNRLLADESQRPFDLAQAPLIRSLLVKLGDTQHALLLTMHHIISDGWSMTIFYEELRAIYLSYLAGFLSPLEELPIQYSDFAVWQRERLVGWRLSEHLSYWRDRLNGAPSRIEWGAASQKRNDRSFRGRRQEIDFPPELAQEIKRVCQQRGVSLFMLLLASFQALLARESKLSDIVIGTRVAGRTRPEIEKLIGFFVNLLPIRAQIEPDATLAQVLDQAREASLGAFSHQDLPIELLVQELRPEGGITHSPLFNVMFVVQNAPFSRLRMPGLEMEDLPKTSSTAKYDIDFTVWETGAGMSGWMEYNADLFEPEYVAGMARRFKRMVEAMLASPWKRVCDVELLEESERRLLGEFGGRRLELSEPSVVEQFQERVERGPDATAWIRGQSYVSYGCLNRRANQLAWRLIRLGLKPEQVVGTLLDRSPESVISLLAIFKAGGAYLPLDPAYPEKRLERALRVARPEVVITRSAEQWRVSGQVGKVILVEDPGLWLGEPTRDPGLRNDPRSLAYVTFTSGSSGEPKGVAVEHGQLLNRLSWERESRPVESDEVMMHRTSVNFSVSVAEMLNGLLQGAATAQVGEEAVGDARMLKEEAARSRVTRMTLVPSLLREMLEASEIGDEELKRLRHCVVCGEALGEELVREFKTKLPWAKLYNQYGSSETNDISCWEAESGQEVKVGRPIGNLRVYVVEEGGRLSPIGQKGEGYVSSPSEARCYYGLGGETAERMRPDWLSGEEGKRLYRTGDVLRWDREGRLRHEGRVDRQLKVRGVRVEPGGIEEVMRGYEGVRQAAVVKVKVEGVGEALAGYVEMKEGEELDVVEMRRYLRERLGESQTPGVIERVERLPLLPNGKIDRNALQLREVKIVTGKDNFEAALTDSERLIAAVWQEVLGIEKIGVNDNFFDVGGHSLLLARVHGKLKTLFHKNISLLEVYKNPTVRMQARLLNKEPAEAPSSLRGSARAQKRKKHMSQRAKSVR